MASRKALKRRKSLNVIAGLAKGGLAKVEVARLSPASQEAVLKGERKNSPMARQAALGMASPRRKKPKYR